MKANTVCPGRVPRVVEQFARTRGIVAVLAHIAVVWPALRWKTTAGGLGVVSVQVANHGLTVDGIGNRLAYAHILQDRIAQVESQVAVNAAGGDLDLETGFAAQSHNCIRGERTAGRNIRASFTQLKRTRGGVGNDGKANAFDARPQPAVPLLGLALDNPSLVHLLPHN